MGAERIGGGSGGLEGFEALRGAAQKRLQRQESERRLAEILEAKRAQTPAASAKNQGLRTASAGLSAPAVAAAYNPTARPPEAAAGPQLGRFVDVRA